jgi:hypothetical protein
MAIFSPVCCHVISSIAIDPSLAQPRRNDEKEHSCYHCPEVVAIGPLEDSRGNSHTSADGKQTVNPIDFGLLRLRTRYHRDILDESYPKPPSM